MSIDRRRFHLASLAALAGGSHALASQESAPAAPAAPIDPAPGPSAAIDGTAAGFRTLGEADFVNVNCLADTWQWKDDFVHCTGNPVGVIRSTKPYTNF